MSNMKNTPPRGMPAGPRGPRAMGPRQPINKKTVLRLLKYLVAYRSRLLLVLLFIIINSVATVYSATFLGTMIDDYITPMLAQASPDFGPLGGAILRMVCLFGVAILVTFLQARMMAVVAHSVLRTIRDEMFDDMQRLPIRYFDTHTHGEVMSCYTNDTDTLRQMVAQSLPNVISSAITLVTVFIAMLNNSVWLTLVVVLCTVATTKISAGIGKSMAKYFIKQQTALASVNGFVEEMINGQKVVKVFNHEGEAKDEFDRRNEELCRNATSANEHGNIMGPVGNNLGHIEYVLLAICGGVIAIAGLPNLSLAHGLAPLTLGALISFLTLSRNFMQPVRMVMEQINFVAMAMAGAERIFALMDENPEQDNGVVTLVHVVEKDGVICESAEPTSMWAWKYPRPDGTVTYEKLRGEVTMSEVDFAYEEGKTVLHDITLYAKPGQKVAFVGATGAGKTTITNLINRFYDIADGKIRYDNININKIRKADLRHSLGVVLQEVNLFTGTVMDNIRYGKLDATDEECIAAAKLANAHDFITRLPDGYNTVLAGDGSGLSQGQRQLISIARAAVANPPVMILDEATSSIDTRTEALVQRGMDQLMKGRTVFVIAHRLSTVQNSDVIMVLDHGRIIERGTHDQLIAQKGQYYQLYTGAFELE